MTLPGLEPRISCSVGRRLIHWAIEPAGRQTSSLEWYLRLNLFSNVGFRLRRPVFGQKLEYWRIWTLISTQTLTRFYFPAKVGFLSQNPTLFLKFSYGGLFFARSLQGIGSALADTSALALVADRFTGRNSNLFFL